MPIHVQIDDLVNVADKATQDTIKTQTDSIKSDTQGLVGMYNPKRYSPLSIEGDYTPADLNTYRPVLDIMGKGYLSKAFVGSSSAALRKIRVTLDGIEIFKGYSSGTNMGLGIGTSENIHKGETTSSVGMTVGGFVNTVTSGGRSHPYLNDSTNQAALVELPDKLFFNTSLKVELSSSTLNGVAYSIRGGIET
jgi:hypothetical protein